MAETKDYKKLLAEPFAVEDIEWRIQKYGTTNDGKHWGMVLAYVTNRAIQQRLDDVFDLQGWHNRFEMSPAGGVMCGISIKFDEWVTKWDGAENTQVEAVKGGLSGAMKRAAVQWGVGRYLYKLDTEFVTLHEDKENHTETMWDKELKKRLYWTPPKLPDFALPKGGK